MSEPKQDLTVPMELALFVATSVPDEKSVKLIISTAPPEVSDDALRAVQKMEKIDMATFSCGWRMGIMSLVIAAQADGPMADVLSQVVKLTREIGKMEEIEKTKLSFKCPECGGASFKRLPVVAGSSGIYFACDSEELCDWKGTLEEFKKAHVSSQKVEQDGA